MSSSPQSNSYDDIPYESHPFAQTHPDRLATVATLVLYFVATISALRLMARGEMGRGILLITLVGAGYSVWTFYGAGKEATLWGLLLLMTAIPVWFGMRLNSLWSSPAPVAAPAAPPESSS